jgi:YidC/Oxa1 family membrane protein insertase
VGSWYDKLLSPIMWIISWGVVEFHKLFSLMFQSNSGWAWGLSIVCLTLAIRALLIPLFVKQIKSMRAMQVIQPEVKALQDKYKRELERAKFDPAKKREVQQKQQRETMALYKEHGTNPFSSCLPVLAQSPFWGALYRLLFNVANGHTFAFMTVALVASINQAHVFGAPVSAHFATSAEALAKVGSSQADVKIVVVTMTLICMATQFITQRQMVLKNSNKDNPMVQQQKMLMYVMPLVMGFIYLLAPLGVLIYMFTSNLWTMGQQFYVLRNNPTPGSVAHDEHLERKAAKAAKKGKPPVEPTAIAPQDEAPAASLTSTGRPKPQRNQPSRTTKSQRTKR